MLELSDGMALNFLDLKKRFSLGDILERQEAFASFAELHCLPFKLRRYDRAGAAKANLQEDRTLYFGKGFTDERAAFYDQVMILKKDFWLWLYRGVMDGAKEDWPGQQVVAGFSGALDASRVKDVVLELVLKKMSNADKDKVTSIREDFPEEWDDCFLTEQVKAILERVKPQPDLRKLLLFLSILEIAEQDARTAPLDPRERKYPEKEPEMRKDGGESKKDKSKDKGKDIDRKTQPDTRRGGGTHQDNTARREDTHPSEKTVQDLKVENEEAVLTPGVTYRAKRYEGNTLSADEYIRTVKLTVGRVGNPYLRAVLSVNGKTLELEQGGMLYCTMTSSGKFIRVLPTRERFGGSALGRRSQTDGALYYTAGGSPVKILPASDGAQISSFAPDPTGDGRSFLYIIGGKLYTDCYEKYQSDYTVKSELMEVKYATYVEVSFTGSGKFIMLRDNGVIVSSDSAYDGRKAVTLENTGTWMSPEYLEAK